MIFKTVKNTYVEEMQRVGSRRDDSLEGLGFPHCLEGNMLPRKKYLRVIQNITVVMITILKRQLKKDAILQQ